MNPSFYDPNLREHSPSSIVLVLCAGQRGSPFIAASDVMQKRLPVTSLVPVSCYWILNRVLRRVAPNRCKSYLNMRHKTLNKCCFSVSSTS